MQIIPVAGGKGGVGKSLMAANLAIALAQAGKKTYLIDMDLGASNLHLILGEYGAKKGIGTFLSKSSAFEEIIIKTQYDNLFFIPGDSEIPGYAALRAKHRNALAKEFIKLNADFIIIDLGAGTHVGVLDFFLLSARGIVVTTPSVTATLDAYIFLKNVIFRMMTVAFPTGSKGAVFLENLRKDATSMQMMYIPKITEQLKDIDKENASIFVRRLERFKPRLIMNMIDDPKDTDKALKIRRSCRQYLDIDLEHLGVVYRDSIQDVALSSKLPVLIYKPQSMVSQAIYRIAEKVIASGLPCDFDFDDFASFADETFENAEAEAQFDYKNRMDYITELVGGESLTAGDLAEMVKTQQFEISILKKENMLLKHKIKKAIEQGFKV
ncbi:MAG: nucleotide-binding protein [Treponema sp.]